MPAGSPPHSAPSTRNAVLAVAFLVAAIVLAHLNGLTGPFVFDDVQSIVENPTIRTLASSAIWSPPAGVTVSGRPLVNASFALNFAVGGLNVRGYHVLNVAIHALAATLLFGLLRRTFVSEKLRTRMGADAVPLALAAALLWALHPLQTEAVTYVVQRAESLVGLFYLLTLYCFARCTVSSRAWGWQIAGVTACALGMATKEVMVTAPVAVLLYDCAFVSGSLVAAWRRHARFYVALATTWLVLAALVWRAGDRAGTAGFSAGIAVWDYAFTQCRAITHYLRLSVWPQPLVFDYGEYERASAVTLLPFVMLIAGILVGAGWLWRRRPGAGFAAVVFFLVLAPTSSVLPIFTEPMAEHRMYLPLAALVAATATGLHMWAGRRGIALLLALALGAGLLTAQRNRDYRSERALWEATVAAVPRNARAHYSLAIALVAQKEWAAAETHFKEATALRPGYVAAHLGWAALLADQRRLAEAESVYLDVVRLKPRDFIAHHALGNLRFEQGRLAQAAEDFGRALETDPQSAAAHNNLGVVLYQSGDLSTAQSHLEAALRLKPDYAEAHYNLGNVQVRQNRLRAARSSYEEALRLVPDYAHAHAHLGVALQNLGEAETAARHYREALRLRPDFEFVRKNLETLLVPPGPR